MSAVSLAQRGSWRVRPKYMVFAFIACMAAYVLYHNERFLLDSASPAWQHYSPLKTWLLPHGLVGATALLLACMQFSTRLRTRYTKLHRIAGRIYVSAVFIVAPLGAYIQYLDERTGDARSFTIAAAVDATVWMLATGVAFWCIRTRRIEQHRQWMTRSLAAALIFLEVRVIAGVSGWESLGSAAAETIVWTCVALAYPIADVALHIEQVLGSRRRARIETTAA